MYDKSQRPLQALPGLPSSLPPLLTCSPKPLQGHCGLYTGRCLLHSTCTGFPCVFQTWQVLSCPGPLYLLGPLLSYLHGWLLHFLQVSAQMSPHWRVFSPTPQGTPHLHITGGHSAWYLLSFYLWICLSLLSSPHSTLHTPSTPHLSVSSIRMGSLLVILHA
jgi:hypothetical protein